MGARTASGRRAIPYGTKIDAVFHGELAAVRSTAPPRRLATSRCPGPPGEPIPGSD